MNVPDFDSCCSFDSPVGNVNLYANNDKVVFLTMGDEAVADWGKAKVLAQAKKQLVDYFKGKNKVLDFPVAFKGTAFQEAVWNEMARLPWGETTTYAEIAEAIGNPKAVRAVCGAVG
jgi:O6-methylguanine-DNA--protein-cysteine methyltransferase